jgi:hypothetical protein
VSAERRSTREPRQNREARAAVTNAHHAVRNYRLTVHRVEDAFGVSLEETFTGGGGMLTTRVVSANRAQTTRVQDAVVLAVKTSGHPASVLAFSGHTPITLGEAAGVRLALTLFATMPLTKSGRLRAMVAGVNAMSVEEAYYWYSKCVGPDAARARRALRLLLADE